MKIKRNTDKKYLQFIREQPCLVCGCTPSDPHHISAGGMGTKCDDNLTVALCRKHHQELHNTGKTSFARNYGIDYQSATQTLQKAYRERTR